MIINAYNKSQQRIRTISLYARACTFRGACMCMWPDKYEPADTHFPLGSSQGLVYVQALQLDKLKRVAAASEEREVSSHWCWGFGALRLAGLEPQPV